MATRPTDFSKTSVTLGGRIVDAGGNDPAVLLYWGERYGGTDPDAWAHTIELGTNGEESFSAKVTAGNTTSANCAVSVRKMSWAT